jgi:hypothetical protein
MEHYWGNTDTFVKTGETNKGDNKQLLVQLDSYVGLLR